MITVSIQGRRPSGISEEMLIEAFRATARAIKKPAKGYVSIAFVPATEMQRLNRTWRKKDATTDVLSFGPAEDFPTVSPEGPHIGDLFLDAVYIRAEAKRRGISFIEEVMRNVIHGALHLYGYDHATIDEERVMFGIQEKLVHSCGKKFTV